MNDTGDSARLAPLIDHTFLGAAGEKGAVERLCAEAKKFGFASVCVNPTCVKEAKRRLRGSSVKVCTVIGFPLGQTFAEVKAAELMYALAEGADECDIVINQRLLKYDRRAFNAELRELACTCDEMRENGYVFLTKLILECCNLTEDEIVYACRKAKAFGFDFVKTSTGFAAGGATVRDVRLMRQTVGAQMGVKAAGGIRDRETALAMVAAGASRLGASAGAALVRGEKKVSR